MPRGEPALVMGIHLRRESDRVVVSAERCDGTFVDLIREPFDAPFSHHITEIGIRTCFAAAGSRSKPDE